MLQTTLPLSTVAELEGRTANRKDQWSTVDLEAKFATGFVKHDVIAGVDLSHETYSNQSFTSTGTGLTSNTIAVVPLVDPPYTAIRTNAVLLVLDHHVEHAPPNPVNGAVDHRLELELDVDQVALREPL